MRKIKPNADGPKIHCLYDELVDPKTLKYPPKNRNKHPKDQIERLSKIIEYQGWRYSIKVSRLSGCVTSGHGRIAAAFLKNWTQVPVVFQEYESSDQEYADVQSDNAIASWAELDLAAINLDIPDIGPEFDIDLLGIKDFTIDAADKYADKDADEVPEVKETDIKLGDLFLLGNHRLLCGDATNKDDVERLMNGEKAQVYFVDPPYGDNVGGLKPKTGSERVHGKDLVKQERTLIGDREINWLRDAFEIANLFVTETKLVFFKWDKLELIKSMASCFGEPSALCVWDRVRKSSAFFRFQPQHELCFHWGNQADKKDTSALSNVWREPKELELKDLHPTVKPIAILEPVIRVCSEAGAIVLDSFLGSGSTLIACEKTNRKCFGMEIDPHYCQVIIDRWEKFTGQKAVKHG